MEEGRQARGRKGGKREWGRGDGSRKYWNKKRNIHI